MPFRVGNILLVWILFLVVSCAPKADVEPLRSPTLTGSLQPYQSPTPSATPLPSTPIPTQTPLPTTTPHTYTVRSGDTMGSIALGFGLDMGDLVNANPDVSPYAMPIGQTLVIPDKDSVLAALPTVQPLALSFAQPNCYSTLSGGMWCFVLVQNDTQMVLEGISLDVRLFDPDGNFLANETAFPLLDRLPAGDAQPVLVYFEGVPANSRAQAEVLTAFEGNLSDERYPNARLQGVFTQISWDGRSASVNGNVFFAEDEVKEIWVVAVAYDKANNVVGVRRVDVASGENEFSLTVTSLDPEIEYVSLFVEAHR